MLAVTLPKDIEERLTNLAQETGRTKTYYVREAVISYIEDMEDIYIGLHRLGTMGKTYTLEEVEKELDLES